MGAVLPEPRLRPERPGKPPQPPRSDGTRGQGLRAGDPPATPRRLDSPRTRGLVWPPPGGRQLELGVRRRRENRLRVRGGVPVPSPSARLPSHQIVSPICGPSAVSFWEPVVPRRRGEVLVPPL